MNSGIYTITSLSGKMYVGSAVNFKRRLSIHWFDLRIGQHHSRPLQAAYDKYGEENLNFSKLLVCGKEDLLFYEQRALDILKPEYNVCKVAGSRLGAKASPETRSKQRGPKPRQHCLNLSRALKIAMGTPEARLRNSITQKKVQGTTEARVANSARQKVAQMKPEVRAKKGRAILCVETAQKFSNGHEAAEWCIKQGLTSNRNAFVWINRAVRDGRSAYGFNWTLPNEKEMSNEK